MNTTTVIQEVVNSNYTNFKLLNPNFDVNFTTDAVLNGRWAEHIFRLSAYLRVPSFVSKVGNNYSLADEKSVFMKSGTKGTGKADAILLSDDSVILVSSKWGNFHGRDAYDVSKLHHMAHDNYPNLKHKFGYAGIDPTFENDNEISFDKDYLVRCWNELWAYATEHDYDWNLINEKTKNRIILQYKKHQLEAIDKAKEVFQNQRDCLFFHSPRTGKTVTALGTAFALESKRVLWLTPIPSINYQVTDTISEFDKFASWNYFDFNDNRSTGDLESSNVVVCSFQRLNPNDNQQLYDSLIDMQWDIVIVDEVHTHSETNTNQDVLDNLKTDKILWLSATPFKNIMLGRFDSSNTHQFTNPELYNLKKTDKSYEKYPQINYFLYSSDAVKKLVSNASQFYNDNEWFTFSKLFEVSNNSFVYQNQVKEFVEGFFINEYNRMGLRSVKQFQKTSNVLLFVPTMQCQKLLCSLMKELFIQHHMDNVYSVDFTNSEINNGKTLKNWIANNNRNSKQVNIVIAVDQLSCGVTLPSCDMVVFWEDGKSEAEYIQRAERCKNPKDDVDDVYVVDFNPHRCLQAHGVQIEANSGREITVTSTIAYLAHMNIMIYNDEQKFQDIDPQLFVHNFEKINYPLRTFATIQTNDTLDDKSLKLISELSNDKDKSNKKIKKLDEDLGREDGIQATTRTSSGTTEEKPIEIDPDVLKEKIKNIKALIPWWYIITKFQHKSLNEIFDSIK
jgi:type I site-specific restriction endonuclease